MGWGLGYAAMAINHRVAGDHHGLMVGGSLDDPNLIQRAMLHRDFNLVVLMQILCCREWHTETHVASGGELYGWLKRIKRICAPNRIRRNIDAVGIVAWFAVLKWSRRNRLAVPVWLVVSVPMTAFVAVAND